MAYETLIVTQDNGIVNVVLNRPEKRNAMNATMISELLYVLKESAHQSRMHALLIQGKGEHFCAGADIRGMQAMATASQTDNLSDAEQLADMLYTLHTFPKPTIVMATGAVMGGGLGLLAAADMAFCTSDAVFGFSEVSLGLAPSTISPYIVKAIGERLARFYFLTGQRFDAQKALDMHLVNACYDNAPELMTAGFALAQTLATYEPKAIAEIKHLLNMVSSEPLTPSLVEKTAKHLAHCRAMPEAQARLQAFFDKPKERG
jgi:methylglutaconyl-CoA hydratase